MAEKVTIMKLEVDLECEKCYKKVKKLLSKYPQIRDQAFSEKENFVVIKVVCCSPEKIRDKLCYKGGGSIKSIEIVELPKPKAEPEKKKEAEKQKTDTPKKEAEKPKAEAEKKKDGGEKPKAEPEKKKEGEKPKGEAPKKDSEKPKDKPAPAPAPLMAPPMAVPVGMLYAPGPCYEGRPVGSFYEYGGPVPYYDGYYARPVYDSYGGGRPCYVNNRCDQYYSEENPSGCIIM